MRPTLMLLLLALAPLAVGCGSSEPSTSSQASGSPSPTPSSSPSSSPSPSPSVSPAPSPGASDVLPPDAPPPGKPREVRTLVGVLSPGVEQGCVLLDDGSRSWLLLGSAVAAGRLDARPGTRVVVVGSPAPGTLTTCQQGEPFLVTELRPASD